MTNKATDHDPARYSNKATDHDPVRYSHDPARYSMGNHES